MTEPSVTMLLAEWRSGNELARDQLMPIVNWNLDAVQLYLGVSDTPLAPQPTPEPGTIFFAGFELAVVGWYLARKRHPARDER